MNHLATIAAVTLALLAASPAWAQGRSTPRADKGSHWLAPYVTSPQPIVDRMLELANLRPGERVYDLGCGDGRVLVTAVQKFKAQAVGVELAPKYVQMAQENLRRNNVQDMAKVIEGNMLEVDLSDADVVVLYLMTDANDRLRPRLERFLRPGARVVSHNFKVPGWKPSRTEKAQAFQRHHPIYVYEMPPAKE